MMTGECCAHRSATGIPHFDAPASPLRSASRSLRSARSGSSFGARSLDGSARGDGGDLDLDGAALGMDKHEAERVLRLQEEEQEAATLGLIRRLEAVSGVRVVRERCEAQRRVGPTRAQLTLIEPDLTPHRPAQHRARLHPGRPAVGHAA
jgi:hypothetical protein